MNPTYYLPGAYWDDKRTFCGSITATYDDGTYSDPDSPLTLFDLVGKRRKLSFRQLFNAESDDEFSALTAKVADCRHLGIALDYFPTATGTISRRFYFHRLSQIINKLKEDKPETDICLILPSRMLPINTNSLTLVR